MHGVKCLDRSDTSSRMVSIPKGRMVSVAARARHSVIIRHYVAVHKAEDVSSYPSVHLDNQADRLLTIVQGLSLPNSCGLVALAWSRPCIRRCCTAVCGHRGIVEFHRKTAQPADLGTRSEPASVADVLHIHGVQTCHSRGDISVSILCSTGHIYFYRK